MSQKISVGDKVRSYDFPQIERNMPEDVIRSTRNCYAEGIVEQVGLIIADYPRYRIRVEKNIFNGEEFPLSERTLVFPPVNGTSNPFNGTTNNVERIS